MGSTSSGGASVSAGGASVSTGASGVAAGAQAASTKLKMIVPQNSNQSVRFMCRPPHLYLELK